MPIVAVLAPLALSFAVKMGVRLAAKAAKAMLGAGAAASSPTATASSTPTGARSGQTFAATLKDEEARLPVTAVPVSAAAVAPAGGTLPLGQVAYQQGVRSLALGAQARARLAWPEPTRHPSYVSLAHRRPPASTV